MPSGGRSPMDETERSEEHTSELQSLAYLVCRLLLEKKKEALDSAVGGARPFDRPEARESRGRPPAHNRRCARDRGVNEERPGWHLQHKYPQRPLSRQKE